MKIAVHWFRCDLRLGDNTALHAAATQCDTVVPLFIFDPAILQADAVSANQVAFMIECLRTLERDIVRAGGKLVFRHGKVLEEMRGVLRASGAHALYYNRDYEPYARKRDAAVEKLARNLAVEVHSFKDNVIHEADEITKPDGGSYGVFTPYRRKWQAAPKPAILPAVRKFRPAKLKLFAGFPLPTARALGFTTDITLPPAGEKAAQTRLDEFLSGDVLHYATERNFPGRSSGSRLSPHLRLGTLSARTVWAATEKAGNHHPEGRSTTDTFVSEIIWRDFYKHILWLHPHVTRGCYKPKFDSLRWENDQQKFAAWCEGRTGFPLVDAGMRQLNTTGWMHNRMRMVTANFLCKDLLVSWQWGDRYFMQKLIDADVAANNGGWQWCAGTGTDAQPWFRIFNPTAQAEKFDPEGRYIHRYVPEVETPDYPPPIVDHSQQRLKTLALFRAISAQ